MEGNTIDFLLHAKALKTFLLFSNEKEHKISFASTHPTYHPLLPVNGIRYNTRARATPHLGTRNYHKHFHTNYSLPHQQSVHILPTICLYTAWRTDNTLPGPFLHHSRHTCSGSVHRELPYTLRCTAAGIRDRIHLLLDSLDRSPSLISASYLFCATFIAKARVHLPNALLQSAL